MWGPLLGAATGLGLGGEGPAPSGAAKVLGQTFQRDLIDLVGTLRQARAEDGELRRIEDLWSSIRHGSPLRGCHLGGLDSRNIKYVRSVDGKSRAVASNGRPRRLTGCHADVILN
jgi:hypothetical protein